MMPVAGETSLATIQSQPLRRRLALAWASRFSVSAAKPTTSGGRLAARQRFARMSGFSTNCRAGGWPEPSFFSLDPEAFTTRQSATAAARMAASAGRAASTAACISRAVSTRITCTPAGGGTLAGPVMKLTRAPRSRRAAASAAPCAPDERLAIKRTGSMGSCVGPEVIRMCLPLSGPPRSTFAMAARIASGSAIRPGPYSPQAISPSSGPTICTPSANNCARLRRVAGCCHIRTFIAGAMRTGVSVASRSVEARSSALPVANLAIRSAVAGAITIRSAVRES